jgi:hypothetical protein
MTPEEYKNFGKYNPNLSNSEMIRNRYADIDKFQSWLREQFRAAKSLPAEITASEIPDLDWKKVKVPEDAIARFDELMKSKREIKNLAEKAPSVKELTQVSGGGMNTLGKAIGPAIAVAQGATVAQGIMDKMKAGESFKEAATNPELVKDAARGALGYLGADAGALAGSMVPGGLPAKAGAELAGAVGGGYLGAKLADLLTGNPVVDKIIRAQYEKARNERMAKTKPTAASSVELRPGE